ncbi:hypothetical protein G9C85_09470 [Halorubellus sp. JP-L1]|uniref:hypothetical protein n=1 Tax=Halorubellus sp. JP-L1 TaxID=2715753 RepID=UPI00140CD45B|nr:hypothetical protein [Halorubellus sp. JP-L1]NHN41858.1 hypothetical protein [Halorubellus sp. JP-L1]
MQQRVNRRTALKGAGTIATVGGLGALGIHAARPASAAELTLQSIELGGVDKTVGPNETVTDIRLTGGLTAEYKSQETAVRHITVGGGLRFQGKNSGDIIRDRKEYTDVAPHQGTVQSEMDVSLREDAQWFAQTDINPDIGNSVEWTFKLDMHVSLNAAPDGEGVDIMGQGYSDTATVKISRPMTGETYIEFSGQYEFSIETDE